MLHNPLPSLTHPPNLNCFFFQTLIFMVILAVKLSKENSKCCVHFETIRLKTNVIPDSLFSLLCV